MFVATSALTLMIPPATMTYAATLTVAMTINATTSISKCDEYVNPDNPHLHASEWCMSACNAVASCHLATKRTYQI
jgi:hypothetical protein